MSVLLDTNVVSELIRKSPDPTAEADMRYGAAILPAGRRDVGEDTGHERTVRKCMVRAPSVMPAAAGVASRTRNRPACTVARLGLP